MNNRRSLIIIGIVAVIGIVAFAGMRLIKAPSPAEAMTGAIWTTNYECIEVNDNVFYTFKTDVYLNGGPGGGGALPDGNYYVQVTDPSNTILGRSYPDTIEVSEGHLVLCYQLWDILYKSSDSTKGYDNTPNNGGEYKVWISKNPDFPGAESKTDNFKVRGTEISASKTATSESIETFNWTIDKSASPDTLNLFRGDSGTTQYTITLTKEAGTSIATIEGTITVTNTGRGTTEGLQIIDEISCDSTVVATQAVDVSSNPTLDRDEEGTYYYSITIPDPACGTYTNTAHVTITNYQQHIGPYGPDATAITELHPVTINDTIHVTDSNGESWGPISDSTQLTYVRTFECDGDAGLNTNIATIEETGQDDTAEVMVNCYDLEVTKEATTAFKREYDWTINKTGSETSLTLAEDQSYLVTYEVTVNLLGITDSSWEVSGIIYVTNPAPIPATINSISDIVSPNIPATVVCGETLPYDLPAYQTMSCTYSTPLPSGDTRTNIATAELQNYHYDDPPVKIGTTKYTGTAPVTFGGPSELIDECVDVTDSYGGALGSACTNEAPKTFTYTRSISFEVCGHYPIANIATFETNDTHTTGDDTWEVDVTVTCPPEGCTLTWGYWKTHSERGPAPYDKGWKEVGPDEEDTLFFPSGSWDDTWYEVLWTPVKGNAYYQLAHQYIAAKLNVLNGAGTTPQVDAALAWAETFFSSHTPSDTLTKNERRQVIKYADKLAKYNEGDIGPGHCDEQ